LIKMIYQVLPTLSYGDAVGNHAMAISRLLRANGYANEIYAEHIHPKCALFCQPFAAFADRVRPFDTVIYHLSTGSPMTYWFKHLTCRKILIYHNITPSEYLEKYNPGAAELTRSGRQGLRDLAGSVDLCIADSQYNANELLDIGYKNVHVIPILISFNDYYMPADYKTLRTLDDGKMNILFVGRIAPNKRQEDVISTFYEYHRYFNSNSRLILAGSDTGMERYSDQLKKYISALEIKDDVIFSGHVNFSHILAYYNVADAFLCMSEHEGFCVPLVESMLFDLPIFARSCGAVPDTLDESGILFKERNFHKIAAVMNFILTHPVQRNILLQAQRDQLKKYNNDTVEKALLSCISEFLKEII